MVNIFGIKSSTSLTLRKKNAAPRTQQHYPHKEFDLQLLTPAAPPPNPLPPPQGTSDADHSLHHPQSNAGRAPHVDSQHDKHFRHQVNHIFGSTQEECHPGPSLYFGPESTAVLPKPRLQGGCNAFTLSMPQHTGMLYLSIFISEFVSILTLIFKLL